MALTQEGPGIFQCLVLALELHDLVVPVDIRGAVSGERVVSHLSHSQAHLLSVESFTPSSSDRSLAVISPDGTTFAAEALNRLSHRFLLWAILNTFRS